MTRRPRAQTDQDFGGDVNPCSRLLRDALSCTVLLYWALRLKWGGGGDNVTPITSSSHVRMHLSVVRSRLEFHRFYRKQYVPLCPV